MENVCSKCGNNLYGNRLKCPFCGTAIGSRNPYNDTVPRSRSNVQGANKKVKAASSPLSGIEIFVLIVISFFIPPLGVVFFFGFNRDQKVFSLVALVAGIFGFIMYAR